MESVEILLKLSRVLVLLAQVTISCLLEIKGGIKGSIVFPGASSKGNLIKYPGTSSTDIISWVNQVNDLLVEYPYLPVIPEILPPIGLPSSIEISEVEWEDNKRIVSDYGKDIIVMEVPETKRSRRTRLSKIYKEI
jgi:hypothetical protein